VLVDLAAADPGPPLPAAAVRVVTSADLDAVVALYGAAARARGHANPVRHEDLRIRWLMLDDPGEAVVVEREGGEPDLLAYASTAVDLDPDDGEVTVHLEAQIDPRATGRGLGGWILELAERVGTEALAAPHVVRIRTALLDGDAAARSWFARRGFTAVRHLLELRLDLHAPPPAPRWPPGITVRTFVPGSDDEVLWRTHQAAFADVPTHLPIARDDYLADRSPAEDPELVLIAEHQPAMTDDAGDRNDHNSDRGSGSGSSSDRGSEVVGIAVCRAGTEVAAEDGWVRDLGVVPGWRRHGIAMALLRTAFAAFRERGLTGVALEVDDVTLEGAVALYRRAGMRVTQRTDVLERVSRRDPTSA
jgi:mycothiol synthase